MQEYGRKQLEHRLQELSDDQANIKVALKSIFTVREPSSNMTYATAPQHSNANLAQMLMSAAKPCVALAELKGNPAPAELRSNEATSTSSHSSPFLGAHSSPFLGAHSSPYLGAINAVQPSTGSFWLYDPVTSAPAGGGGGRGVGSRRTSSASIGASNASTGLGNTGSPRLSGQPTSYSANQPAPTASLSAAFSAVGVGDGSAQVGNVTHLPSRKRPRESATCLPAQALSFNQITGGPELFCCTLCGLHVAKRDDGTTLVCDVAVAICGHLYCTGCLCSAILSGLPDEMYKCRRCGLHPHLYDRIRHGVATQRVDVFKVCCACFLASPLGRVAAWARPRCHAPFAVQISNSAPRRRAPKFCENLHEDQYAKSALILLRP